MAVEIGQFYFQINFADTLEPSPIPTEPEPAKSPDLSTRARELNGLINVVNSRDTYAYDKVIGNWLTSKFAPPEQYLSIVYQEFIRPSPRYWETEAWEVSEWPGNFAVLNERIVKRIMETEKVSFLGAIDLINGAFDVFNNVLNEVSRIDEYRQYHEDEFFTSQDEDKVTYPYPILLHNPYLSIRSIKQLALAGIFTRTQFQQLSSEQIKAISQIRVPRKFIFLPGFENLITVLSK